MRKYNGFFSSKIENLPEAVESQFLLKGSYQIGMSTISNIM
jgi:hypothetical protein